MLVTMLFGPHLFATYTKTLMGEGRRIISCEPERPATRRHRWVTGCRGSELYVRNGRRLSWRPGLAALIAAVLALSACAGAIRQKYDPELKQTITYMSGNKIGRAGGFNLYVNAAKIQAGDEARYALRMESRGPDWLRVKNVTLLIDGKGLDLGRGIQTAAEVVCWIQGGVARDLGIRRPERCSHRETHSYDLTSADLKRLAGANRVVLRLEGYELYLLKSFSRENIDKIRAFVSQHVS